MHGKIECDWFKPSKHEVSTCDDTKIFATKIIMFSTLENKMREMHSNTDINKLNWRFRYFQ